MQVLMRARSNELPYIGLIQHAWEGSDGQKLVMTRWYLRQSDLKGFKDCHIHTQMAPNELLLSHSTDINHTDSILRRIEIADHPVIGMHQMGPFFCRFIFDRSTKSVAPLKHDADGKPNFIGSSGQRDASASAARDNSGSASMLAPVGGHPRGGGGGGAGAHAAGLGARAPIVGALMGAVAAGGPHPPAPGRTGVPMMGLMGAAGAAMEGVPGMMAPSAPAPGVFPGVWPPGLEGLRAQLFGGGPTASAAAMNLANLLAAVGAPGGAPATHGVAPHPGADPASAGGHPRGAHGSGLGAMPHRPPHLQPRPGPRAGRQPGGLESGAAARGPAAHGDPAVGSAASRPARRRGPTRGRASDRRRAGHSKTFRAPRPVRAPRRPSGRRGPRRPPARRPAGSRRRPPPTRRPG